MTTESFLLGSTRMIDEKCEFANSKLEKRLYALNLGFHGLKFGEYDIHM